MATTQSTPDTTDLIDRFDAFYRDYYEDAIATLAQRFPRDQKSLHVDWQNLYRFDPDLADDYLANPEQLTEYAEEALRLYDLPVDVDLAGANVRVYNLPATQRFSVGDTRVDHRGNALSITGLVQKSSGVEPKITMAAFECKRCGTLTRIPQVSGDYQEPHECQGCERQGPFRINFGQSEFIDHQSLRVQKPPEEAKGDSGGTIDVVLEDDLVEAAQPGDRVDVNGVYKFEQSGDKETTFDTYVDGITVEQQEQDFQDIDFGDYEDEIAAIANGEYGDPLEVMVNSIAPSLYGMDSIKLAALLQLFSGTRVEQPDGSVIRGDFHILLLGDPGCGKSSLLDAIKSIAPRATKASGKGASAAGMTAAAVRDDFGNTEWGIEAGALVMADGGIACVDEIDKIDDSAVSSLHNALEAQQVEVAKAGINATLPARTALLAAGNPKYGRFDQYENLAEQIDLAPSLLSRFDLIYLLNDEPDREEDADLAEHMLETKRAGNLWTHGTETDPSDTIRMELDADVLRAYIAYARQNVHPHIPEELDDVVTDWFVEFRQANGGDTDNPVPVTARKVEAIERIAEAHARARLSETVSEQDLQRATALIEDSLRDVGMDPDTGQFDADVVETGMSKSQTELVKDLVEIIDEQETEHDGPVPKHIILQEAMDADYDRDRTEHCLEETLKEKGEVYEPQEDHYLTT